MHKPSAEATSLSNRQASHKHISARLGNFGDEEIEFLLQNAVPKHVGIGGVSSLLEIDGHQIFVKKIPLTDLERTSESYRSTANIFNLPLFYQYRIGSAGFGAWRELAAHEITTHWVVTGEHQSFPLLHHWRVIEHASPSAFDQKQIDDLNKMVEFWGSSEAIRNRLELLQSSSAQLVLFVESLPFNMHEWLHTKLIADDLTAAQAIAKIEQSTKATFEFTSEHGFAHLDPHFDNVLAHHEGEMFVGDFGLALSHKFDLSQREMEFLEAHRTYDRCVALTSLVHALVAQTLGRDHWEPRLREFIGTNTGRTDMLPSIAAALIRNAPVALAMTEFYRELQHSLATTTYPATKMHQLLCAIDGL